MRSRHVAALLAALLVAACGTRLPDEAFEAQGQIVTDGTVADGTAVDDAGNPIADDTTDTSSGGSDNGGGSGNDDPTTPGSNDPGTAGDGPNEASDTGVTETTLTIGTIVAENGALGDAFAPAARGLRAWVEATNRKGGIHDRQIILKTCDDGEVRTKALECARRLVEQEKVFALVATNTRAMGGAAQYLEDQGVPVIGIPITNSFYRYKHFWGAYEQGYARDGKTVGYKGDLMYFTGIYEWFKANLKITKAAVFSYDIDESRQAGDFIEKGLGLVGIETDRYVVSFAAPSFDQPVNEMKNNGVQAVFDAMDDGANRRLCDSMDARSFKVKAKVSTVVSMGDAVGTRYNDTCRNSVYIPGDSVAYSNTKNAEVAEFRAAFARYQPGKPLHQWALEAWGLGNMFGEGVDASAPTRKSLEAFLKGLNNYQAGGLFTSLDYFKIDYSKPTGRDCFTIARWQDSAKGWVEQAGAFPHCVTAKLFSAAALEQGN